MRVLSVLEFLQSRESISGTELARRLEISSRSVQRYIARLQDLGIPVEGKRGAGGTYKLKPGFRMPPLMLSNEEATAMTLGFMALEHLGLNALTPAAEVAAAKLTRLLPNSLREEIEALRAAVQLDVADSVVLTDAQVLANLLTAMRQSRSINIQYLSEQKQSSRREVNLYRILQFRGRWYAIGFCKNKKDMRAFRLDRIEEASISENMFEPPTSFDAAEFIRLAVATEPEAYRIRVWLAATPQELRGRLSPWGTRIEAHNGGTQIEAHRTELEAFAGMVLGLGCEFKIEEPKELLLAVAAVVKRGQEHLGQNH